MVKLGISAFYHDSAAALIIDNEVIAAAEEERFTGIKHDSSFPKNAIKISYDLIIINILAKPIMQMAKDISKRLNQNGRVILSGILNTQIFMVSNKFRKFGLIVDRFYLINKWATIILKPYMPPKL